MYDSLFTKIFIILFYYFNCPVKCGWNKFDINLKRICFRWQPFTYFCIYLYINDIIFVYNTHMHALLGMNVFQIFFWLILFSVPVWENLSFWYVWKNIVFCDMYIDQMFWPNEITGLLFAREKTVPKTYCLCGIFLWYSLDVEKLCFLK